MPDDAYKSVSKGAAVPTLAHVVARKTPPNTAAGPKSKPNACLAPGYMITPAQPKPEEDMSGISCGPALVLPATEPAAAAPSVNQPE